MNKALMKAVMVAQTAAMFADLVPLTEEERDIKESYDAMSCGGSQRDYRRKIEAQWKRKGKTLNPAVFGDERDNFAIFPLAVCVPISNPNAHDYTLGKPVLFIVQNVYNLPTLDTKNHNNLTLDRASLRAATEAEIDAIIEKHGDMIVTRYKFVGKPTKANVAAVIAAL